VTPIRNALESASRLAALKRLNLTDSRAQQNFDRLTRLAQRLLGVPISLFSLIDDKRQYLRSAQGLTGMHAEESELPLERSLCRHVVEAGEPLAIADVREHPLMQGNPAIAENGVVAYLGIPVFSSDGFAVGAFCAIDTKPRTWRADEVELMVELTGFFGSLEDVAAAKTAQAKLRWALDQVVRQQFALDQHAIVAVTDLKGTITYANDKFCEISGYTREELLGQNHRILKSGLHPKEFYRDMYQTISQRKVWRGEICNRAKDGHLYWLASTFVPFIDQEGKLEQYVAIRSDITAIKRLTEELLFTQARLRTFVEHSPAAVAMFDRDMRYLLASRQWHTDYQLEGRDVIGLSHYEVFPEISERWREDHRACLSGAVIRTDADLLLRSDGSKQWLSYEVRPWHQTDGSIGGVVMFTRDITQHKLAEAERERLEQKLMETQKMESLGVLAGGIAHDFNNILTGIMGNNSLALNELPSGSPIREHLDSVNESSHRAAELIKQMLAYSGRGRFVIQKLDLSRVVEETSQLLGISISKKINLHYNLGRGLPAVDVDASQISQIIVNLVINASEAIGDWPGEVLISTGQMQVDKDFLAKDGLSNPLEPGEYVFVEVMDNGSGITPENLKRIFEPFFTTKFTGRGLGLAAALGIVRSHKGAFSVATEVGRGTHFKMLIPCSSGELEVPAVQPLEDHVWRGKGNILIIEDEETVRVTLERILIWLGFAVVIACDGREGVAKFSSAPGGFALVLLDLTMPQLDGAQVFAEIRRLNPTVPVVLMSGYNEKDATAHFADHGLAGFIQKPFDIPTLQSTLKTALARGIVPGPPCGL